jgi:hypothetical protein
MALTKTEKYKPVYDFGGRIEALHSLDNHAQLMALIDILFECSESDPDTGNRHFIFTLELQKDLMRIRGE